MCFYNTIKKKPITPITFSTNKLVYHKPEQTIICGHSGSAKTYLMNHILNKLNPDDVYIICRSKGQYPDKYVNQSTELLPLEDYQNKTVFFDDMLCSKKTGEIDQFFTRSRHQNIIIIYISQSWYDLPKNTIRKSCSVIMLFKQTFKDIVLLYNDVSSLDMDRKEWREMCSKAWSIPHNYIQINKLADINLRYSIRNVKDPLVICCIPETSHFLIH